MIGKTNLSGGENVTPEVTAQTPIIENIMTSLEGKVWEDKKGLYVWKKYDISPNTPLEITAIQQTATFVNYIGYLPFVLDSTNVDLSTVSINYFFNMIFQTTSISSEPYTIKDNGFGRAVAISGSRTYDVTWDAPTKTLTFSRGDTNFGNDIRTWTVTTNKVLESTFLGYVVSDKENSYPDGGTQGGYWYEKVVEKDFGFEKVSFSKVTPTSNTYSISFSHDLGEIPKKVFVYTTNEEQTSVSNIHTIIGVFPGNETYQSAGFGSGSNYKNAPFKESSDSASYAYRRMTATSAKITCESSGSNYGCFLGGVEHICIAMA